MVAHFPWMIDDCLQRTHDLEYFCDGVDVMAIIDERTMNDWDSIALLIKVLPESNIVENMPEPFKKDPRLLSLLENDPNIFQYFDKSLKDEEHIRKAIEINTEVLDIILDDEELATIVKSNRDMVLLSLRLGVSQEHLDYFSNEIGFDKEMAIAALDGQSKLNHLPQKFLDDLEIVKYVLRIDPKAPLGNCKQLTGNKDSAMEIVKCGPILRYISTDLLKIHPEIAEEDIKTYFGSYFACPNNSNYLNLANESLLSLLRKPLVTIFLKETQLFKEVCYIYCPM